MNEVKTPDLSANAPTMIDPIQPPPIPEQKPDQLTTQQDLPPVVVNTQLEKAQENPLDSLATIKAKIAELDSRRTPEDSPHNRKIRREQEAYFRQQMAVQPEEVLYSLAIDDKTFRDLYVKEKGKEFSVDTKDPLTVIDKQVALFKELLIASANQLPGDQREYFLKNRIQPNVAAKRRTLIRQFVKQHPDKASLLENKSKYLDKVVAKVTGSISPVQQSSDQVTQEGTQQVQGEPEIPEITQHRMTADALSTQNEIQKAVETFTQPVITEDPVSQESSLLQKAVQYSQENNADKPQIKGRSALIASVLGKEGANASQDNREQDVTSVVANVNQEIHESERVHNSDVSETIAGVGKESELVENPLSSINEETITVLGTPVPSEVRDEVRETSQVTTPFVPSENESEDQMQEKRVEAFTTPTMSEGDSVPATSFLDEKPDTSFDSLSQLEEETHENNSLPITPVSETSSQAVKQKKGLFGSLLGRLRR